METKTALVKIKPVDGSAKGKFDPSVNKKRIESSGKQIVDSKPRIVSTVVKSEVRSKTTSGSGSSRATTTKKTTSTSTTTVKQKKVYTLSGQRYDPPEEREPLRIFYESLSKQIPTSEMAEFWMMEHGLLSPERAKRAYERKQRRQKEIRSGTPIKSSSKPLSRPENSSKQLSRPESSSKPLSRPGSSSKPLSRPESSSRQQVSKNGDVKAKRITNDSDDDDFILSPKRRKV